MLSLARQQYDGIEQPAVQAADDVADFLFGCAAVREDEKLVPPDIRATTARARRRPAGHRLHSGCIRPHSRAHRYR